LAFCKPLRQIPAFKSLVTFLSRGFGSVASVAAVFSLIAQPVFAQESIPLIRDTEMERVLRGYEDPLLKAAGLDPAAVHIYIVQDSNLNAFVAEGQNVFVNTGAFMHTNSPNELIGILAHETGHMKAGHLTRDTQAMHKAMIPMLISMAVGAAAIAMGAGQAGMGAMMYGQQLAQAQFDSFSRVQEATADQIGQSLLLKTHQSGEGMLDVFQRMANEDAMSAAYGQQFATDHPADRERISNLQDRVDASPYKDVKDSPEAMHEFHMIQAKLAGYLYDPDMVLEHYPPSDTSEPARYARVMAYFRKPDLKKALGEANSLIAEEPNNPYFQEILGQIYVEMSQPEKGVGPYQKSVDLLPDAPLLRISLAAAQLATENPKLAQPALENLQIALQQEDDNSFGWYEMAEAYSRMNNEPMADLSTAERYYADGAMQPAAVFAMRAEMKLPKGSPDWQRATDIVSVAGPQGRQNQDQ